MKKYILVSLGLLLCGCADSNFQSVDQLSQSSSDQALLTWDPVPNVTGYKIQYGNAPGSYTGAVDVGNKSNYKFSNLSLGKTYYFVVTAYNGAGESGYSNEVSKNIK